MVHRRMTDPAQGHVRKKMTPSGRGQCHMRDVEILGPP